MKLGFFTAAFPQLTLEAVARWAAENAFNSLEHQSQVKVFWSMSRVFRRLLDPV
jgi:sugar phosphate isomerase/epimerase